MATYFLLLLQINTETTSPMALMGFPFPEKLFQDFSGNIDTPLLMEEETFILLTKYPQHLLVQLPFLYVLPHIVKQCERASVSG